MSLPHQIVVTEEGHRSLTILLPGQSPIVVNGDHPHYAELVRLVDKGTAEEVNRLANPGQEIGDRFRALSKRLTIHGSTIFFDGDPVHNSLTTHIVRCLSEKGDWKPLVNFFERIQTNPNERSREQLFEWLQRRDFTITEDGHVIAYKGVKPATEKDKYLSVNQGPAIVDGVNVSGAVPNNPGSVVEFPRSKVDDNPNASCSTGLHVGDFTYANDFGDITLKVLVDPRDVVSVPKDSDAAKVRCCRYEVIEVVKKPVTRPIERKAKSNKSQTKGDGVNASTRDALRKLATKFGIEGRGSMNKDQLAKAVTDHKVSILSRDELRREATRLNIEGRGRMNKDQLQGSVAKALLG